jgi:hypothetical protein
LYVEGGRAKTASEVQLLLSAASQSIVSRKTGGNLALGVFHDEKERDAMKFL